MKSKPTDFKVINKEIGYTAFSTTPDVPEDEIWTMDKIEGYSHMAARSTHYWCWIGDYLTEHTTLYKVTGLEEGLQEHPTVIWRPLLDISPENRKIVSISLLQAIAKVIQLERSWRS